MAKIWGLDLNDMSWSKFGNNYMWRNKDYHRRRTKFIIYQCAMILCVVSESLGTAALSDYVNQQSFLASRSPPAHIHNNTFIGIASFNIFVGIYVATIFGSAFFFDLFWPERQESRAVKRAWKICSVLACMLTLGCALAYTYIVATQSAWVTGVDGATAQRGLKEYGGSPLRYKRNGRAVASVVCLWVGWVFTCLSTVLLWRSLAYIDEHGPKSKHARTGDEAGKTAPEKRVDDGSIAESTHPTQPDQPHITQPAQAHVKKENSVV